MWLIQEVFREPLDFRAAGTGTRGWGDSEIVVGTRDEEKLPQRRGGAENDRERLNFGEEIMRARITRCVNGIEEQPLLPCASAGG